MAATTTHKHFAATRDRAICSRHECTVEDGKFPKKDIPGVIMASPFRVSSWLIVRVILAPSAESLPENDVREGETEEWSIMLVMFSSFFLLTFLPLFTSHFPLDPAYLIAAGTYAGRISNHLTCCIIIIKRDYYIRCRHPRINRSRVHKNEMKSGPTKAIKKLAWTRGPHSESNIEEENKVRVYIQRLPGRTFFKDLSS